jgi:Ca2+:H+ antiporter
MLGLTGRRPAIAMTVLVLAVAAGVVTETGQPVVLRFVVTGLALAGLAWMVSVGTELAGSHFGPGATGLLQSTLGNLPELFVVVFALRAGETIVAEASIVGSLLSNSLLVLGLVLIAGTRVSPTGRMSFHARLPNDTSTLFLLSVFTISLLSVSLSEHDRASHHALTISAVGAVVMLVVYLAWLRHYLRTDPTAAGAGAGEPDPAVPLAVALVMLIVAGVGSAFVSDWFVQALTPAVHQLGISRVFAGFVIVALAGNAVENTAGIVLAAKGKYDLAVSVVLNSVAQIAAFLYPALVLISLALSTHLTFGLPVILIVALVLTAIAVWQVIGDGEAYIYEGLALVALYVILAAVTFYE